MKKLIVAMMITAVPNLIGAALIIENNSGHNVKLAVTYSEGPENGTDYLWLDPDFQIDVGLSGRTLLAITAFYTGPISEEYLDKVVTYGRQESDPEITSKGVVFRIPGTQIGLMENVYSQESMKYYALLHKAKYLPVMTITDDAVNKQPKINFPEDVKSLQAAIEAEAINHEAPKIAKEVREAEPQFQIPGVPEIIGGFAAVPFRE